MNLPRLLVLTDRTMCSRPLVDVLATAVECGARAIVLREKDLPADARVELAARLRRLLAPVSGTLIVAGPGYGACHLAASDTFPSPRPPLVGRSCHSVAEVDRATAEGCDYATVSPVFVTKSKPGYGPAHGLSGLASLCRASLPVYALGGVMPASAAECVAAGAHGVAVMGPVMRDPSSVSAYLAALPEVPE